MPSSPSGLGQVHLPRGCGVIQRQGVLSPGLATQHATSEQNLELQKEKKNRNLFLIRIFAPQVQLFLKIS